MVTGPIQAMTKTLGRSFYRLAAAKYWAIAASVILVLGFAEQPATGKEDIKFCATGSITLGPFKQHIAELRKTNRYSAEEIAKSIANQRAGGLEFFSSQVVIKKEQSSSGDYDLNRFQGFSDPQAKYRRQTNWSCEADDYPIVYFVGFKVREFRNGAIFVSREKGKVNVISLKKLDPSSNKHTKVQDFESHSVLCNDIGNGCSKGIFYGLY
jgi:hypothetical protein